jgi:hypothetical protein
MQASNFNFQYMLVCRFAPLFFFIFAFISFTSTNMLDKKLFFSLFLELFNGKCIVNGFLSNI